MAVDPKASAMMVKRCPTAHISLKCVVHSLFKLCPSTPTMSLAIALWTLCSSLIVGFFTWSNFLTLSGVRAIAAGIDLLLNLQSSCFLVLVDVRKLHLHLEGGLTFGM